MGFDVVEAYLVGGEGYRGARYVIRVASDRSGDDLPASTRAALASSHDRTVSVVGSRLGADDGLTATAG